MIRINYRILVYYFLVYVILQLPLLYKYVFADKAFGFFYIGFLVFLPYGLNPFIRLLIGFFVGLLVDIFSNTPGLHAMSCTTLMYLKDDWFVIVKGDPDDDANLSIYRFGIIGSFLYLAPLILLHHILIFFIEHGKLQGFFMITERIIFSSLFTYITIIAINIVITNRPKRI